MMKKLSKLDRPELEKKYLDLLAENNALKFFVMKLAAALHCPYKNPEDLKEIKQKLDEVLSGAQAVRRRVPVPDGPVYLNYERRKVSTEDILRLDDDLDFLTDRQRELVELFQAKLSHSEIQTVCQLKSISTSIEQLLLKYFKIVDGIAKPRYGRNKHYKLKTERTLPADDDENSSQ